MDEGVHEYVMFGIVFTIVPDKQCGSGILNYSSTAISKRRDRAILSEDAPQSLASYLDGSARVSAVNRSYPN